MKKALVYFVSLAVHGALLLGAMAVTLYSRVTPYEGGVSVGIREGNGVGIAMAPEPTGEIRSGRPVMDLIEPDRAEFEPLAFDPVPSERTNRDVPSPAVRGGSSREQRDHARFAGAAREGGSAGNGEGGSRPAPVVETDAALIEQPAPAYPRRAREKRLEGTVVIRFDILMDGTTANIRVGASSGHSILDDAAAQAVAKYRYSPATRNGKPVASAREVPITFKLK